ncbi:MAG: glutaminyl-peptide cyclotransferase [Gemmatimonadota bacterium]
MKKRHLTLWVGVLVFIGSGCAPEDITVEWELAGSFPHDTTAYTQGLLFHDRHLFESTGQYGESTLRKVNPESGAVVAQVALDSAYFGEGLALVGDTLVQLTWKEGVAFLYGVDSLESRGQFTYDGEGWGLCFDGSDLFMSDGTNVLQRRDAATFDLLEEISVEQDGFAVRQLNELECVGDHIYANVYLTDRIVQIDKVSGNVVGEINGARLSVPGGRPRDHGAVLNGIAYVEATDIFLMTGKLWRHVLAVRLNDPEGP